MQTTFLIFGLTGDLMKKKGIPALFELWKEKRLPEDFRVVGLSRKVWTAEKISAHISDALGETAPTDFAGIFSIFTGEGEKASDIEKIKEEYALDAGKLFAYLCVSPELYAQIITNLQDAKLLPVLSALLIEKPFGSDLESARSLQKLLIGYGFPEEKIYRIDHFLAKEAMNDLSSFAADEVSSIEVYLNEALGVEKRGAMYDPVGAFRDVGQNHLLESAATILGDRIRALESLHVLSAEQIATHTKRAQHEGYRDIEGVKTDSQTETYFKVESWFEMLGRKIPLRMQSGKCLPSRREVVVTLQDGEKIIPFESGINEYETLFGEAFYGDRSRFVSMHEVEALWKFTDPIEKGWRENATPLLSYKPFSSDILSA